jgi:hypothetical protein
MLIIFAGGLWLPEQVGQGPAMGLPGYLLAVAMGLASILLIRRLGHPEGSAAVDPVAWGSGPGWLLVGGALAYSLLGAGVLAWPAVGVGLLCLLLGTVWGRATDRLHPSPSVRRGLVGGGLGVLAALLLPRAVIGWCLSAPLVYLLVPPALLPLVVLAIPTRDRPGGAVRILAWLGGVGAALALLVAVLAASGLGSFALCG